MTKLIENSTRYKESVKRKRKNTESKVLENLLNFLRTKEHKHMLYWEEEESVFSVVYVHKKNEKWKPKDISLFRAIDKIFHHTPSGTDYEERSKGRFKANMLRLCKNGYLKELHPPQKIDKSTRKVSYCILNRQFSHAGENGFFRSVNRESAKVEVREEQGSIDMHNPEQIAPISKSSNAFRGAVDGIDQNDSVEVEISEMSEYAVFILNLLSALTDMLPQINDNSLSSLNPPEPETSTPNHDLTGEKVSSNSMEVQADCFPESFLTSEETDCNNSMDSNCDSMSMSTSLQSYDNHNLTWEKVSSNSLERQADILESFLTSEQTDCNNSVPLEMDSNCGSMSMSASLQSYDNHDLTWEEVSSNSLEGQADILESFLTSEETDCNNSVPLEIDSNCDSMSMSASLQSYDVDLEIEKQLYSDMNAKECLIGSNDPILTSSVCSLEKPNTSTMPFNLGTLDQWQDRTYIDVLEHL